VALQQIPNPAPLNSLRLAALLCGWMWMVSTATPLAAQIKFEGQVLNGTTGRAVPNQIVQLLAGGAGMREAATSTTDAQGRFVLALPGAETGAFHLVQTVFQGVNYRARAAERGATQLTVFEATDTAPDLRIRSARIVVEAAGAQAQVQEFFAVENNSSPPRTFANPEGTFRFWMGNDAAQPSAAVLGQMNMPIPVAIQDGSSPGELIINHALQPGLTVVMVNYAADYGSGSLAVESRVDYPIGRAELLVSPNNLAVESPLFKPAGTDSSTGMEKYEALDLAGGITLAARVSGQAPPQARQDRPASEGEVRTEPNSMSRLGVLLMACLLLVLLWALGVRAAKEWKPSQAQKPESAAQKELEAKLDALLNSMADLDELHESGKIADKAYWKERLDLKAKVVAILKQRPPKLLESHAPPHLPR
jgi:hypothetical protein